MNDAQIRLPTRLDRADQSNVYANRMVTLNKLRHCSTNSVMHAAIGAVQFPSLRFQGSSTATSSTVRACGSCANSARI
jgi:hypothetical protein